MCGRILQIDGDAPRTLAIEGGGHRIGIAPASDARAELSQRLEDERARLGRDGDVTARALRRVSQGTALDAMMVLGANEAAAPEARAFILETLAQLGANIGRRSDADPVTAAFYRQSARRITAYLDDPVAHAPKKLAPEWGKGPRSRFPMPPGPPLG